MTIKPTNIPDGWNKVELGLLVDHIKGFAFKSQDYSDHGRRIIRVSDLGQNTIKKDGDQVFIDEFKAIDYLKWEIKENDLIFTTVGSKPPQYDSLVGRVLKVSKTNIGNLLNQNAVIVRVKPTSNASQIYIYNHFITKRYIFFIEGIIRGNANQGSITLEDLFRFPLLLPPLPEQHRIVAVLETWDHYLDQLDQKIKLKKQIKKGLMQQLLTGRKRLNGFSSEWKSTEIGQTLKYEQPGNYIVKSDNYDDSHKIPVLTANKTFILGYTDETDGIYRNLPVIIFDDFTTLNKYVEFPFKVKSSAIKMLKTRSSHFNLKFIYERMQLVSYKVGEHKRSFISEYQYLDIKIPEIEEQIAIANILTTADQEIEALENKRKVIAQQKKYLLNQLITGELRLPEFRN